MAVQSRPAFADERPVNIRLPTFGFGPQSRHTAVTLNRSQRSSTCRAFSYSARCLQPTALEDGVGDPLAHLPRHAFDPIPTRARTVDCPCPGLARRVVGGCADVVVQAQGLERRPGQVSQHQGLASFASKPNDRTLGQFRLWAIVKRFFATTVDVLAGTNPALVEKLRRATPHWMRHTHATHALQRGAELTTVRDNLRHASLSTTSMYLHSDDARRAKQIGGAFDAPVA